MIKVINTLFCLLITVSIMAQKSNYRRILICAPDSLNIDFNKQISIFDNERQGCDERDIIIETYTSDKLSVSIYKKYNIAPLQFTLLLIGKDGYPKFRSKKIVTAQSIFDLIDTMPMRQDEMKAHKKKN
jgi:hypothetical protein